MAKAAALCAEASRTPSGAASTVVIEPVSGPPTPRPGNPPDVLIAVVTFNSAAVIEPFLRALPEALKGAGTAKVVVVDNDSHDATTSLVRAIAPWAAIIESGTNRGYAAGINAALVDVKARRGVYVLNPDTVPSPGSVALLADAAESRPGVGITAPRVVDNHGNLKFSLRREPTILRAIGEGFLGGHRAARFPWAGEMIRDPAHYVDGAVADWATGAALFLSAHTVSRVGLWDEGYFLYSEETDYALRTRDSGLRVSLVAAAEVAHPGGDMETSPWLWSLVAVNRVRLYRKRHGRLLGALYWCIVLISEGIRACLGRATNRAAFIALLRRPTSSRAPYARARPEASARRS